MRHLNIFFVVTGAIGILLPMVAPHTKPRVERRLFWIGFIIAIISAVLIFYPPDAGTGLGFAFLVSFTMIVRAYMSTSYIKIRGRIYAFHLDDSRPDPSPDGSSSHDDGPDYDPAPDSYSGMATAGKMWTLLILTMAICSFNVVIYIVDRERPLFACVAAVLLVTFAAVSGYGDAVWGYPIARGQRIQFVVISIITASVFTVVYLGAYIAGRRWPRRNKRSMEYRAHPRSQQTRP